MGIDIKINEFEGPLDLLLHLIKQSKMDIFNIEIENISKQYMDYLNQQESMNLEIASEYLILGSELIEIKSKMLLPSFTGEQDEEEDPREELVSRLIEYQTYKEITKVLEEKESLRKEIYTKTPENITKYIDNEKIDSCSDVTIDDLVEAFKKFLERKKEDKPLHTKVLINEISVSSRRKFISNVLKEKKKISFFELFPVISKEYVVATFLAILEMARSHEIVIKQDRTFDDIICEVSNE